MRDYTTGNGNINGITHFVRVTIIGRMKMNISEGEKGCEHAEDTRFNKECVISLQQLVLVWRKLQAGESKSY
jgi:hypothetical protein